jgi:hypothetical protein
VPPRRDGRDRIEAISVILDNHIDARLRDRIAIIADRTMVPGGGVDLPGDRRDFPIGRPGDRPIDRPIDRPRPPKLTPGTPGPDRHLPAKELTALLRRAIAADQRRVVWTRRGNEATVHLDSIRVAVDDGVLLVGLTLDTDQTGPQELTAVLAVGGKKRTAGLLAVAEERPRGHGDLAATFAEAVIASAWRGILLVVASVAASAGKDAHGDPLVPVALTASREGLTVHTIADHRLGKR